MPALPPPRLALGLLMLGACCREEPGPSGHAVGPASSVAPGPSSSAASSAAASASPAPLAKVPPSVEVTASAADGLSLYGSLHASPEPGAPLVVLLHRLAGSREEWGPLLGRLFRASPPPSVLALDLRGHGRSTARKEGKGSVLWAELARKDEAALTSDVISMIAAAEAKLGSKPSSLWLVGTDLGATVAALVAAREPRVAGLSLISPGAAIRGIDIFRPFAEVRTRPSFLAAAEGDNIAQEPMKTLPQMGRSNATVKTYPGKEHGAAFLGAAQPSLWDDLGSWLLAHAAPATKGPVGGEASAGASVAPRPSGAPSSPAP